MAQSLFNRTIVFPLDLCQAAFGGKLEFTVYENSILQLIPLIKMKLKCAGIITRKVYQNMLCF